MDDCSDFDLPLCLFMTILTEPISHPPNEYRSRAPEFYGFVAWTSTSFLFVVYVLWALLPDEYIVRAGVEWYPNRRVCFWILSSRRTYNDMNK